MSFLKTVSSKQNFKTVIPAVISEAAFSLSNNVSKSSTITFADVVNALYAKYAEGVFTKKELTTAMSYSDLEVYNITTTLKKAGYIDSASGAGKYTLSQISIDFASHTSVADLKDAEEEVLGSDDLEGLGGEEEAKAAENSGEVAQGVKDIEKLRVKKFVVPNVGNNSKYRDQIKTILSHMKSSGQGLTKTTYLLAGDVGTGKTSFLNSISTLTGVPLVIIEAPHITQEHIINIPFLVIDGAKRRSGNVTIDDSTGAMKVVQAESNLVSQLKMHKQKSRDEIEDKLSRNPALNAVYNAPDVKRRLMGIDGMFNSILFLDEYFRTSSKKIKNVLRNILNGQIGNDKIPAGVYIMMASNVDDDGVDDIPENYDFQMMKYEAPDKEDFFDYLKSKYVKDEETEQASMTGIEMKPEVFNKFYEMIDNTTFGTNDEASGVRLSPRRLEQMIIYIDAMTPCKNEDDIRGLLTFVKTNLSNYLTGDTFNQMPRIMDTVKQIIKETSPEVAEKVDNLSPFEKSDWKKSFANEISAKLKLGENRKYIPVISGDPGIGKTSVMHTVAQDENMGLICIDVSNLSPEDFTGMPIADQSGTEITTTFSEPSLYNFIMKQYNAQIADVKQEGRPYNVILLFDEISRTTPAVFNSMRKVLLEKEFSEEYPLPSDIIVTGALNPAGEGTTELTKHSVDVLNIISATAKFSEVIKYATTRKVVTDVNTNLGFDASGIVGNIITSLAREFESKERPDTGEKLNLEESPFWWTVNGETFYISGREYTESIANIIAQMEDRLLDMNWDKDANYEDTDYDSFMQEALNVTANVFGQTLNMVVTKMKVQNFVPTLIGKIINNPKFKGSFSPMKERKTSDEMPLDELYKLAGGTPDVISKRMIGSYLRYTTSPTQFGQDFSRLISSLIESMSMNDVSLVIIGIAEKMNQIFVELEYPEAVSNAYNDIMLKTTKVAIRSMFENPSIDFFDSEELIDAILRVF
jgi:MoxR-like ATPase